ncbi:hypothetical protein [Pontiella sulfatireligans]|uniref:ATP-binding protein n=1 Tax=Pontiella sulfatireligans TaxID=2750658 RepID=A0A6C2UJ55_9BACT|nr:hypothetical protein [Pontiella sulfatireligans]VGO20250.1 hypothetical protein SCARR_02311 [Pontiella sulfatireligans]
MKKLIDKAHHIKIEKTRARKILRQRHRRLPKRKNKRTSHLLSRRCRFDLTITRKVKGGYIVEMPTVCSLQHNHAALINACAEIRKFSKCDKRLRAINFDNITELEPSAALLIAAETSHLNDRKGLQYMRPKPDGWEPEIKRLLSQMGFFELFGVEAPDDLEYEHRRSFLKFFSGKSVTDTKKTGELRERIEKRFGQTLSPRQRQALYEGLSEAITNTQGHAYGSAYPVDIDKWWLSAAYDFEKEVLTIMFVDLGRTIPGTLPKKGWFEKAVHKIGLMGDGEAIKAAMEYSRTRTAQPNRGKGMSEFLHFPQSVERTKNYLTIYSKKGKYTEVTQEEKTIERNPESMNIMLKGTLIEWKVSL